MRTPKILMRLAVLLITAGGVLFSDIVYKGNEYAETMMPYSYSGSNENFIVISGSIENYNSSRLSIFEINGVNMNNSSELPAAEDGKKYFIHLKGQNKNASFSVSGINDWSVEQPLDTTAIILPFTKTGAGKYFFSTTDNIGSLTSANMDTLLINNQIFTNQTVTDLPEKEEGYYYIYYSASLSTAAMMIESPAEPKPEMPEFIRYNGNDYTVEKMPYSYRGRTESYVAVSGTISSYSSNALNIFEINGVDMNNASGLPDPEDGKKYFIHLKGQNKNASFSVSGINNWSVEQPLDTTAIILPFTKTGAGKYFFSTTDNIGSLTSANMDTLLINNQIFTNQTVTDLPEKDEGYYYIYYSASLSTAAMIIESPAEPEPEIPEFIRYNGNDYTFIEMPWTYIGGSVTRVYTYGKITSFNTNNFITSLEINGQSYTVNQTHTDPPASIGQKYFITIIPKNQKGKFEIDGETKKIVHKLNIKVLLEGAL